MAILPASTSRKFNPADYKIAEEWFKGRFLSQLNLFTEPVYTALLNGLTFQQNFNAQYFSQILTAGATPDKNAFSFKMSISGYPTEVIIASCNFASDPTIPLLSPVGISWYADAGIVHITAVSGLTAASVYKIVLRIS